ncbi:MAG: [acyl-carrier-protein] S-malonyltransferase, partial [Marinoscillum sp.]
QNVDAKGHVDIMEIKSNLVSQLTAPVRWTQSVNAMIADGATSFVECGPGKVLQGLIRKIDSGVETASI